MRSCPSTSCGKITTIPEGARVEVYSCNGWCELSYAGRHGYASARYIALGGYRPSPSPPVFIPPVPLPPAIYWDFGRPTWDSRYRTWHDGRRWWYDGRWHSRPPRSGFTFEFNF